jgi:ABC-2 type transport system ATP-binding protein
MGTNYCIRVSNLSVKYGKFIAVDDISFKVKCGTIFGFLGPNGSGKTTTINVLTTLIQPSFGFASILDMDPIKKPLDIKKRIGVILQEPSFEPNQTAKQALDLYGKLWGLKSQNRFDRINELLTLFELDDVKDIRNDELSIGQRRRVQIAREFMHDIDLLFLDEPTVGLDPSSRRILLDYVKGKARDGLTIFFTTHIMEEAEYICDEIAIINKGKIIALDTPSNLKKKLGGKITVEIKLRNTDPKFTLPLIRPYFTALEIETHSKDTIRFTSTDAQKTIIQIHNVFSEHQIGIENISINNPTLENIFIDIVKKNI